MTGLLDRRLLFVTGKGGVGKTVVAAAIGLLASEIGKRVLLCEAEARGDVAVAFECGSTGFVPKQVEPGLFAMSMDTEASLREYLHLHLHVPVVGRLGPIASAFDFVATAAPGVREILTVGKLCHEVRQRNYDLVVVDAPSTGYIVGELAAPGGISELVRFGGAIKQQTGWMLDLLTDSATTGVCIVTTPEETPVDEAIELSGRIEHETGVSLAGVIANRVLPELFSSTEERLFSEIEAAVVSGESRSDHEFGGFDGRPDAVFGAARLAVALRRIGAQHLERLRAHIPSDIPVLYLPYLFGRAHGPRATRQIAQALGEEIGR